MVRIHPVSCREKQGCREGKHGAYAQTWLRHNTAEHREFRLQDTREEKDPQYTDDNAIRLENNKKALAVPLNKKKKVASFVLRLGKVWEKEKSGSGERTGGALGTA